MTLSKKITEFLSKEEALKSIVPKLVSKFLFFVYSSELHENGFTFSDFYLLEYKNVEDNEPRFLIAEKLVVGTF